MVTGSFYKGDGKCNFAVWTPFLEKMHLKIVSPEKQTLSMKKNREGYWTVSAKRRPPGVLYVYELNETLARPDPASHFQPEGVHGPSQVVDHNLFQWSDLQWRGIPLDDYIIYELHVGTFTEEGTFLSAIQKLNCPVELGITAVEFMPVQIPETSKPGYCGVSKTSSTGSSVSLKGCGFPRRRSTSKRSACWLVLRSNDG